MKAAFRSYRVRKNLQQVRHAFEEIATQLDSGSITVTWTKSNLPCNPSFYTKKDEKTRSTIHTRNTLH